jgi:hypothetical protein
MNAGPIILQRVFDVDDQSISPVCLYDWARKFAIYKLKVLAKADEVMLRFTID